VTTSQRRRTVGRAVLRRNSTFSGGPTLSTAPENAAASGAHGEGVLRPSSQGRATAGRSLAWAVVLLVAAGVLVNVHLAVLARVLSEAEYGRFITFVSIVLLLSFGGFLPIEQEMARQFQTGHPGREVFRSNALVAGGIACVAAALVAGLVPWLVPSLADPQIMVALLGVCLVSVVQYLVRGTLVGTGRLPTHGMVVLGDAALRLGFAALVVLVTAEGAGAGGYALALVAAIAGAHLPVLVWAHRLAGREPGRVQVGSSTRQTSQLVGHLIAGSISSQILLNAPPILVAAIATSGEADLVGRFAATYTLARLLLFIAVPMQGALVPIFTRAMADGRRRDRRLLALRISLGGLASALLGATVAWVAGPWVIEIVFGARYALEARDVALMVAGAMLYLGLLVAAQALIGADRHRHVGLSWTLGLLSSAAVFITVPGLVLRAELAFAAGSFVGLLVAIASLWRSTSRPEASSTPLPAAEERS